MLETMCLSDAPSNVILKILEINSDNDIRRKLLSMGIHPFDSLMKLSNSNYGAILIKNLTNGASKLAVGRVLAKKIIVDYDRN